MRHAASLRKAVTAAAAASLLLFLTVGLGKAADEAEAADAASAAEVSFDGDIQPYLTQNCYICHLTGSASAELVLEPGAAHGNLVGVPSTQSDMNRVEAGEPASSYLLHKLRGTHTEAGGYGDQMPQGGTPAPEEFLELLEAWIAAGAPAN